MLFTCSLKFNRHFDSKYRATWWCNRGTVILECDSKVSPDTVLRISNITDNLVTLEIAEGEPEYSLLVSNFHFSLLEEKYRVDFKENDPCQIVHVQKCIHDGILDYVIVTLLPYTANHGILNCTIRDKDGNISQDKVDIIIKRSEDS